MHACFRQFAAALALLSTMGPSSAAVHFFSDPASFLAATVTSAVDSFDDFSVPAFIPSPLARQAGPFHYSAASVLDPDLQFLFAAPDTTGQSSAWLSTDIAESVIRFDSFGGVVNGAGGYIFPTNFSQDVARGAITITAVFPSGSYTESISDINRPRPFAAFLSDGEPLLSLTLGVVQPNDGALWVTVDDLALGSVTTVDEAPASLLAMVGCAWIALFVRRSRRGRASS